MEITEVQVKLVSNMDERLKASCSLTMDGEFVIRDVKVIEGTNGLFVAMPSRKLADHCPKCGSKNHLRARFCNNCGARLKENRVPRKGGDRVQLHAEIAHPINSACRERIQARVLEAYAAELAAAAERGPQEGVAADDDDIEIIEPASEEQAPRRAGPPAGEYDDFLSELKTEAQRRRGSPEPAPADLEEDEQSVPARQPEPARSPAPVVSASPAAVPGGRAKPAKVDDFGAGLV